MSFIKLTDVAADAVAMVFVSTSMNCVCQSAVIVGAKSMNSKGPIRVFLPLTFLLHCGLYLPLFITQRVYFVSIRLTLTVVEFCHMFVKYLCACVCKMSTQSLRPLFEMYECVTRVSVAVVIFLCYVSVAAAFVACHGLIL